MDFLAFRKFVTPVIIQVLFWIGVILVFVGSIIMMASGDAGKVVGGVFLLIFGPIYVRVASELMILLFRVYDELQQINTNTKGGAGTAA